MTRIAWEQRDRSTLAERGISMEEAERQLELFRRSSHHVELVRPCTVGDGIRRLDEEDPELADLQSEAARAGRFSKFVPASGAASRMFRDLVHFHRGPGASLDPAALHAEADEGNGRAKAVARLLEQIRRFAFYEALGRELAGRSADLDALASRGEFRKVLDALLAEDGLGYEALPKGLLAFHRYEGGPRTPFEEHLVEAAHVVRRHDGVCRLHVTVSPEHRRGFEALLASVRSSLEKRFGVRYEVSFSVQKPSTDTLAADLDNRPARDEDGRLILRPGGHGALIENLDDSRGDLVFIKNIDNVQREDTIATTLRWKRLLGGFLVRLQQRVASHLRAMRDASNTADAVEAAASFLREELGLDHGGTAASRRPWLIDRLDRPIRVCGVVPNTGEPGGGPMWVRDGDGNVTAQIVESAQVDRDDPRQEGVLRASTHFNPVDIVCAVRGADGESYDLGRFVDPDAVIVTRKSAGGRELKALERPGLWNGGMARWNTVFVEVPLETFTPVKTVLDLLRDEHQPS